MHPTSFILIAVLVLGSLALLLQSPPAVRPRLHPFDHAGHQYLGDHTSSIHDPDCPCRVGSVEP